MDQTEISNIIKTTKDLLPESHEDFKINSDSFSLMMKTDFMWEDPTILTMAFFSLISQFIKRQFSELEIIDLITDIEYMIYKMGLFSKSLHDDLISECR